MKRIDVPRSVFVVIVNYRTPKMVVECLASIEAAARSCAARATVLDNASGDGSVEYLTETIERRKWNHWVSMKSLERNGGFAFGNNAGIRAVLGQSNSVDYVMLLNPDAVPLPGAIDALVDFMDSHPDAGIAGSRLQDEYGVIQCSAHKAPSPLGELEGAARFGPLSGLLKTYAVSGPVVDQAHQCDWISGASFLVRRKVFDDVGLMDEGYFLYFEEVDFCQRARRAGWTVWFVPESHVIHREGAATGIRDARQRRPPYWYDSRRRYFVKHFGVSGLLLADTLFLIGRASLALRRLLHLGSGGTQQDPRWFALDLILGDLRALFGGDVFRIMREAPGR